MQAYHPDRVVRVLTTLVSVAYVALSGAAILVLIAAPALKLFAAAGPEWVWGLQVPATLSDSEAIVPTSWGSARLEVEDVRANLRLPIGTLPWWLFALLWAHAAVAFGLILLFLHQLRSIFRRAREGVPFDARNAVRLRRLGLLLIAFSVFNGVAESVTSVAVGRGLTSGSITVPAGLYFDLRLIFIALVLVALGEIFHRGAELETEQSLVV
jgi:hypothetical protein